MNWTIALPEIVLAVVGMAILVFGVLRKRGQLLPVAPCSPSAASCSPRLLVLTRAGGIGYHGQFAADAFAAFVKILILAGAALSLILSLDYNRKQHIARFEFPVLMLFAAVGMMVMARRPT